MISEKGKLLVTPYRDKILCLLMHNNRFVLASAVSPQGGIINNIYIGKVTNVVKNIEAAFVEILPGQICFLSVKECKHAMLTNRAYDGRILAGDEIVVQVVKEAIKTKQPVLSANISFSGTYCVVTTGKRKIGYSAKLTEKEKEDLKQGIMPWKDSLDTESFGYVFRTNCRELEGDYEILKEEAKSLTDKARTCLKTASYKTCYSLLEEAPAPYLSVICSVYQNDYEEIVTDSREIFENLLKEGSIRKPVRFYEDSMLSLQKLYSVETKLEEALAKRVWLKSGGYLVIEATEALTVIDVNTGKSVGNKNAQEHCFKINMEAAEEIGLQLRLRNISGIVIVDFINMQSKEEEKLLVSKLKSILKKDPVTANVIDITELGLVEITRKKINKPLSEQLRSQAGRV